ncbi:Flavone 3'-O-methyltransferase 1 [Citrus sinensis]|uniref:Flavone 3'-O-methyltransferase 1 n=1 Tax=Citrus sinensis TaxID=2711 RepID=A0ACB8MEY7_CITSI|nr:Flavone 3'-O-methyltransferase 1 [Citrus sinensis]
MASIADQEEETNNFSHAMGLASAIVLPAVMQAVVELDVFEIISKAGPGAKLSVAEIVAQIPLKDNNPEAAATTLDRVLRLLVSYNALHCSFVDGQRLYSLAPVSKHFVRNNRDGVSLRPYMALCLDKICLDGWFGLKKQILEGGIAFNKAHGMQIYDYLGVDSRFNDVFNNGMLSHTSIVMEKVLESYKGFEHVKKLVDVGGGLGITLNMIISKYPHIKGINYDLPYVIKDAPSYSGIEHIGGDLFESIPEADTIFMKWMLHSFDDEQALKVLKNCYKALPDGGKLLNINSTISEMPGNNVASREISILDTVLLVQLPHGRERTKHEYTELAVKAGFKGVNYDYGACNLYVMEFFK